MCSVVGLTAVLQDLEDLIDLERQCGAVLHASIDLIPVNWIASAPTKKLMSVGQVQICAWHRDLCWHLAPIDDVDHRQFAEKVQACLNLAEILGEVPRDTVYTYASRAYSASPATFSGTTQEICFVHALQDASRCLLLLTRSALASCIARNNGTEVEENDLADGILDLGRIMSRVIRGVDVATFVQQIEPNFKRKTIAQTTYYGPTAAQLPLVSLEALLYGASASDSLRRHVLFQRAYMPRALRTVIDYGLEEPPLLFGYLSNKASRQVQKNIERFRRIHLAIARKAFALQTHPSPKAREILESLLAHPCTSTPTTPTAP